MPQCSKTILQLALLIALSAAIGFAALKSTITESSNIKNITPNPTPQPAPQTAQDTGTNIITPIEIIITDPTYSTNPQEIPTIFVGIRGAIVEPDTYEMPLGARTQDLIDTAHGITPNADLTDINIAAILIDQSVLTIPSQNLTGMAGDTLIARGYPKAAELNLPSYTRSQWQIPNTPPHNETPTTNPTQSNFPKTTTNRININTASAAQLETLPGIGPITAAKIIAFRQHTPFTNIQDLQSVPGIGPKRFQTVQHLIAIN